MDEIAWAREHSYLTLVNDIGGKTKRLLAVECKRTEQAYGLVRKLSASQSVRRCITCAVTC
jgi:hypothetical protein